MLRYIAAFVMALSLILSSSTTFADELRKDDPQSRLILAHYMPWYVAKPHSQVWGWHWTMNHFDPEQETNGRREIASKLYPLIGPYDSGDAYVLEYHLLQMKLAGIDGVIVDWYGREEFRDYAILHRNTQQLIEQIERFNMKFAICYEDQTIPALVESGRVASEDKVAHAVSDLDWLAQHWFPLKSYVQLDGQPMLLSFGQSGLKNEEWSQCLNGLKAPVAYFSEHHRRDAAVGAFDWPVASEGLKAIDRFNQNRKSWPHSIPVAYPRFDDIYAEAKVHESWGHIDNARGQTFRTTMEKALSTNAPIIQIATWNDWGEGTVIEPNQEFGNRDLQVVQRLRRETFDPAFAPVSVDLQLPYRLFLERRAASTSVRQDQLDRIAELLSSGKTDAARALLSDGPRSR